MPASALVPCLRVESVAVEASRVVEPSEEGKGQGTSLYIYVDRFFVIESVPMRNTNEYSLPLKAELVFPFAICSCSVLLTLLRYTNKGDWPMYEAVPFLCLRYGPQEYVRSDA